MVTKGRPSTADDPVSHSAASRQLNGVVLPVNAAATSNGNIHPRPPGELPAESHPLPKQDPNNAELQATPDMQAPKNGQANPQEPPDPPGEAPAESETEKKRQEDQILAEAETMRSLHRTLALAKERPWQEPQKPLSHWDFLLREAAWLAVDVAQERHWKICVAKELAHHAAKFHSSTKLQPAPGPAGDEVREMIAQARSAQEDDAVQTRRAHRERLESGKNAGVSSSGRIRSGEDTVVGAISAGGVMGPSTPQPTQSTLCYLTTQELIKAAETALKASADNAVIALEMKIREYELQYEKSLEEAREQAVAARRQIAAELRGREATPLTEFDDEFGKKNRRKKARSSLDDFGLDAEVLVPSKRVTNLRKQQTSRPDSTLSDDRRDIDAGVETSGRREREVKRKRKLREYDDEDYEEPLRTRETHKRKPPVDRDKRNVIRNEPRSLRSLTKKASGLGQRHGSRGALDADEVFPWSSTEEQLLCSIVHEFGSNWRLVADILATSNSLAGIFRTALACRTKFKEMAAPHAPEGQELQEQAALEALRINKSLARDLINKSLPAPDAILALHQKVLLRMAKACREKRLEAREQEKRNGLRQSEPHATIIAAQEQALRTNMGRIPTPLQLIETTDAQQQALAAQQLAAQQQAAAAQQAAAVAAAAPPVAPGASGGPAVASGGAYNGATSALGPDSNISSVARQTSMSSQQQQTQQAPVPHHLQPQTQPGSQGTMSQASTAAPSPFQMPTALQSMPPPASVPQPPPQRPITIAQLQQILSSGRMPNGQAINENMRAQLMGRLSSMQRAAAAAAANRAGMQPGMMQQAAQPGISAGQTQGLQLPPGSMRPPTMPQMQAGQMQAAANPAVPMNNVAGGTGGPAGSMGVPMPAGMPGMMGGMPQGQQKSWPAGMPPPRMPNMRPSAAPGMGLPVMSQSMSQSMQSGINPGMVQPRPQMQGLPQGSLQQPP